ncbi:MAG: choice-of-anchor B family protein [Gammaproteobacteria bacterium]|nr:choice-of-anchor B family protein [Gammaproteobacteria bacterium]
MSAYYKDIFRPAAVTMYKPLLAVAAVLLLGSASIADTLDPPLYVAPSGTDAGNCRDESAPCRSIDFALQRVGKNGQIRVAAGSYTLSSPEDVFYLVSNAIDVRADAGATLVGVPPEFAGDLLTRGFRVIADSKGLNRRTAQKLGATKQALAAGSAAAGCVGGFAGSFPCDKVDLVSHVNDRSSSASGADIWGFIDLNTNREYAIMGYSTGTAVYDISDADNPREVGFIDGQRTTWRDIKVYQAWNAGQQRWDAYAYVTADNASDGLFIIDLTGLPQRISRVNYAGDFAEAHNVYLARADFSTGLALTDDPPLLIIAGSNRSDGRFRTYLLDNPRAPAFTAMPATPAGQAAGNRLYMHDGASMLVTDTRKDSQCVNAATSPWCDIVFDFNESTLDIWDLTDPLDPVRLSQTPYGNASYTHSGWWSEDQQYVFLQDELDERDSGLNTTLRAFSIADLRNPTLVGTWTGPTRAIDHNGFVRGNRYYMSNYARGLSILDITDPADMRLVGHFDSYPSSDGVGFPGAWGTYPFLPSGRVLISDIDTGFYIVEDRTRDVSQGSLSFTAGSFASSETESPAIVVQRAGGATGAVAVGWEIIGGSGSLTDVAVASGTLSWSDGDAGSKVIDLGIVNDGSAEGLERLVVRLVAPKGGATLSAPSLASLYVSDPGDTPTVGFSAASIEAAERGFGHAVAVVQRRGSATGAVSVAWSVNGGDASAGADYSGPANGTLTWNDGDADPKTIEFAISDDGSGEGDEFFELALGSATGAAITGNASLRVTILDGTGLNVAPNAVAGGSQTVSSGVNVTLDGRASNDPDGDALDYSWTQVGGPAVTLNNATTATASFTAPSVRSDSLLRFELTVSDPGGLQDTAATAVTIRSGSSAGGSGGGGGGGALSLWLIALILCERMRLYDRLFAIRAR